MAAIKGQCPSVLATKQQKQQQNKNIKNNRCTKIYQLHTCSQYLLTSGDKDTDKIVTYDVHYPDAAMF